MAKYGHIWPNFLPLGARSGRFGQIWPNMANFRCGNLWLKMFHGFVRDVLSAKSGSCSFHAPKVARPAAAARDGDLPESHYLDRINPVVPQSLYANEVQRVRAQFGAVRIAGDIDAPEAVIGHRQTACRIDEQ